VGGRWRGVLVDFVDFWIWKVSFALKMEPKRRKLSQALQNGEDPVVTAWDVLHEMNHLQDEAQHAAASGWGDEKYDHSH
jgi:hypothetical protein